ncbi:class I SAM-dependent methyltransferase [Methanolobus sp. ZRKC2]|uniref:class I SAM-dependent methyltransferase n=1 Tax=Methanolobus sp. ZRKC2 TaxID=3125783 RepID=UPI003246CF04
MAYKNVIDWNGIWKEQTLLQNQSHHGVDCASIWEEKESAQLFLKMFEEDGTLLIRKTIDELPLTPDSRILDIGSGPGTLAIPLSKMVSHITAVEPSGGMVDVLEERIAKDRIDNITCVNKRWEDIDTGVDIDSSYDIVIASYSLGMPDIREAVRKMEEVSSKYICLYWFAGETSWDSNFKELWPSLHGTQYYPSPKCNVLYNVLYDMGIYPNVSVFPFEHIHRFSSEEDAVEHFRSYYKISEENQVEILSNYLKNHLEKDNNSLILRATNTRVKLWWEKGELSHGK